VSDVLNDGIVALRPLSKDDAESIAEACRTAPDVVHWVMRLPSLDEPGAQTWIEQRRERERDGQQITRTIVATDSEDLQGVVWLGRFDREARRAELAYWTAAAARNRGVATAAVRLMANYGFAQLKLIRIQILAPVQNVASRRVAERAGFTDEGLLRSYRNIAGEQTDLVMYSLLNSELK
jgi:RimJ/RimL family protein N-acetyltransferase